jgi:AcrR family transcriptional regulator
MDDVATQAGIGKGTIYLHWKTREALFEAVLQREWIALVTDLAVAVRQDPGEALPHRMGRLYLLSVMNRPLMRAFFTADLDMLGKLVRSQRLRAVQLDCMRHDLFRLLAEHGVVRTDIPPEPLAYAYRTIIIGFFLVDPLWG